MIGFLAGVACGFVLGTLAAAAWVAWGIDRDDLFPQ